MAFTLPAVTAPPKKQNQFYTLNWEHCLPVIFSSIRAGSHFPHLNCKSFLKWNYNQLVVVLFCFSIRTTETKFQTEPPWPSSRSYADLSASFTFDFSKLQIRAMTSESAACWCHRANLCRYQLINHNSWRPSYFRVVKQKLYLAVAQKGN